MRKTQDNCLFLPKAKGRTNATLPSDLPVYRIGLRVPSGETGDTAQAVRTAILMNVDRYPLPAGAKPPPQVLN